MELFNRIRAVLSGLHACPPEHLAAYRRIGEEVYGVEVELAGCETPRALALMRAAKGFQVMADALLFDAFSSAGTAVASVPVITHELAESWYERIPELLIGARQEAMFAGSAKTGFPVRLGKRIEARGACPVQHLAGMRRAAAALEDLLQEGLERARLQPDMHREALLLNERAGVNRRVADAMVGSIMGGQHVSIKTHEEAEQKYWEVLAEWLIVIQAMEDPSALRSIAANKNPTSKSAVRTRLDSADVWKVTSQAAQLQIRRSGEWEAAEKDLAELWSVHRITDGEREYEHTVARLLHQGDIRENGYWHCCPFQPVYQVARGSVRVVGHSIPSGHVFVWDYGEAGTAGRFVTRSSFDRTGSRHYCAD